MASSMHPVVKRALPMLLLRQVLTTLCHVEKHGLHSWTPFCAILHCRDRLDMWHGLLEFAATAVIQALLVFAVQTGAIGVPGWYLGPW